MMIQPAKIASKYRPPLFLILTLVLEMAVKLCPARAGSCWFRTFGFTSLLISESTVNHFSLSHLQSKYPASDRSNR